MYKKLSSLAGDTTVYGIFTVVNRFLSFILTPLYSNYLLTSQFDFLIFLFSFSAILSFLYTMGMETAYLRFFNANSEEDSKQVFSIAYSTVNISALFFTVLIMLNAEFIVSLSGYSHIAGAGNLIIIAAMVPFLDVLSNIPFNHLRITGKAFKLSAIKFITIVISVILHFVLLSKYNYQAEGALIAQIAANSFSFILLLPIILNNFVLKFSKELVANIYKFALPVIPAGLATVFLQVADRPLLKFLTNSEIAITTYQVNYRLAIPMLIFVSVFDFAWQPFYLNNHKECGAQILFGRVMTYYTLISAFLFLSLTFFMGYIVRIPFAGGTLINSIYWDGLQIIPLIVLSYFFYGLYVNFSAGVIIGKKTSATSIALVSATIINILLNILLVPGFGYFGAAYSIIAAYFSAMLIIYFFSKKYFTVNYEWKRVFIIVMLTAIIYFIISYLTEYFTSFASIIIIKIFGLMLFMILLKITGFFTSGEIDFLKRFFRLSKN